VRLDVLFSLFSPLPMGQDFANTVSRRPVWTTDSNQRAQATAPLHERFACCYRFCLVGAAV